MGLNTTVIPFNFCNHSYPADFPQSLDLTETDPLSCLSYAEEVERAQKACMPYYSIAIAELETKDKGTSYKIYDASYFATYCTNANNSNTTLIDPYTQLTVQKVHYFALRCFQADNQSICKAIDLKSTSEYFHLIGTSDLKDTLSKMLIDSLNVNIVEANSVPDKFQVRRTQYIAAEFIKREPKLLKHVSESDKKKESQIWLWCSAQGSIEGTLKLAQLCQESPVFLSSCHEELSKIIDNATENLPSQLSKLSSNSKQKEISALTKLSPIKQAINKTIAEQNKEETLSTNTRHSMESKTRLKSSQKLSAHKNF